MPDDVKLPVVPEGPTINMLARLAREVAYNIRPLSAILDTFKITQAQYDDYLKLPFYKTALETAVLEWESADKAERRIQLQSLAAIEDGLPTVAARMTNPESALPAVVETGKLLSTWAGIGKAGPAANPGEKFVITINLGDAQPIKFEKDVTPNTPPVKEIEHEQT